MSNRTKLIKRLMLIVLVFAVAAFTGCGDKDKSDDKEEKKASKKTEQSVDESAEDEDKEETDSGNESGKTKKKKKKSKSREEQMVESKTDDDTSASINDSVGSSFAGDWEGMTLLYDSKGTTKGKGAVGISDDYIIGTYGRFKFDDDGNLQMDIVGITIPQLNFSIDSANYDPDSDSVSVSGKLGGGTFDTVINAPGDNGVLTFSGRTNGDIKSNYVVYMKRLDSEWDRSDAPQIADKEYNIYVVNNIPNSKGRTLEERVASYEEAGMDVDMSDFLKP